MGTLPVAEPGDVRVDRSGRGVGTLPVAEPGDVRVDRSGRGAGAGRFIGIGGMLGNVVGIGNEVGNVTAENKYTENYIHPSDKIISTEKHNRKRF